MYFRILTNIVSNSKAARKLSLLVLLALLSVQFAFVIPFLWLQHYALIDTIVEAERSQLQASLNYTDPEHLESSTALSNTLIGLIVTSTSGAPVFSKGELPDIGDLQYDRPSGVSRLRGTVDTMWLMQTERGRVLASARIDTHQVTWQTLFNSLKLVAFALFASIAGALVALWGAYHNYIRPLDSLIDALHDSRSNGNSGIPDDVDYQGADDLNPIAEEFNSLIAEQRKAARQVKVKQQYLEFAAHHDPLTHLPNRLMFESTLKKTVAAAVQEDLKFAIFLVDLDNFKFFNDQYGHLVGDKMVAEIGSRLRAMMRDSDLVARLDGDEFVVIQMDVENRGAAADVARRLMGVATAPYEYHGFTLKAAVSVGISCYPLDVHCDNSEEALREEIVNNASVALQEAKSNGKNQYQLFDETMRSRLTNRMRLEQDLKLALQEKQFEVFYQPKIDISSRKVTGAEALVRWKHPTDGYISPEIFVPVAEEIGLIIELGEWILRTACMQTHQLQQSGFVGLNVAVNISAVQFTDGNLLPMVSKALKDSQLKPQLLELEITESAVMHDPEEVINSLHELSRFGMRLAIDDFGTGYSSLAYLKRFPVHTLKIDRAFITDISSDSDDVAIVEAVLGLGKHFNMKVVAEGVEDEAQLQFLQSQGCELAQGYFISKPMNMSDYMAWLESWPHGLYTPETHSNVVPLVAGGENFRR